MSHDDDAFSRRPTAPSGHLIMPGQRREPVHDARREPEDDPVSNMIDGVLPKDPATAAMFKQLNRIVRSQATMASGLLATNAEVHKLTAWKETVEQGQVATRYVSPLPRSYNLSGAKVPLSTPPMANPDREGDVLIAMRAKCTSIPDGETEDERADRIEKELKEGNAKVGSLTEALDELRAQVTNMQKTAPAVAVAAGTAAGAAATSEISRILTNKNFTTAIATIFTVIASVFGAGAYQAHRQEQNTKAQTVDVERAAKAGAQEASKTEGPNVFIVHDGTVQPVSSGAVLIPRQKSKE